MIIKLLICILFVTINYIRIEGPKSLYIPKTLNQKELPLSYPVPLCLRRFFQRFSRTEEFRSLNTVLCPRIPGMSGSHGLRSSIVELFATTKRFGFYCSLAKKYIKILIKMPLSFRFWTTWNVCLCTSHKVEVVEVNSKDGGLRVEPCSTHQQISAAPARIRILRRCFQLEFR